MKTVVNTLEKLGHTNLMVSNPDEDIRGRMVVDSAGEKIGKVDELMVDGSQGKVRFLQVGSGGFLGLGREHVLIPVDAITRITEDTVYINQSMQYLSKSPQYSPDLVTNEAYYRDIYNYYGYSPYWEEGYQYPPYPYYNQIR